MHDTAVEFHEPYRWQETKAAPRGLHGMLEVRRRDRF